MTRQLVWYGAAVASTLLALVLLWQFQLVVLYILISLTLAAALRPLVARLVEGGIIARAAWLLLYLVVLGSFGSLLFPAGDAAIQEVQRLAQTVSVQDAWRLPAWLEGSEFQTVLMARLPAPSKLFSDMLGSQGQLVLPALFGLTQGIGDVVSGVFLILLLSIYWSISQVHFERFWLSLLPAGQRKPARDIWRTVESDSGAYLRRQMIQSLLAGVLFGLGYWLLGSPYPVLLALAGAFACLIPVVGAALAVILPILWGLPTSLQLSLLTALYALAVVMALSIWVKPRLFNRGFDNASLTVILLIALAEAFGLAGIILAPPLSVVCQILWRHLVSHHSAAGATADLADLKERQAQVWANIQAMDESPLPLMTSSMARLTQLIDEAEPILQAALPVEPAARQ
jgi:predicted PurR-regulated permease PerM